jgi:hypothetical protein
MATPSARKVPFFTFFRRHQGWPDLVMRGHGPPSTPFSSGSGAVNSTKPIQVLKAISRFVRLPNAQGWIEGKSVLE